MTPFDLLILCGLAPLAAYVATWLLIDWWMDRRAAAEMENFWESYASAWRDSAKAALVYPVKDGAYRCPECGYEDSRPLGQCPRCDV